MWILKLTLDSALDQGHGRMAGEVGEKEEGVGTFRLCGTDVHKGMKS